jgi:hypothetical protein
MLLDTSSESPVMVAGGVDTNRGGRRPATVDGGGHEG